MLVLTQSHTRTVSNIHTHTHGRARTHAPANCQTSRSPANYYTCERRHFSPHIYVRAYYILCRKHFGSLIHCRSLSRTISSIASESLVSNKQRSWSGENSHARWASALCLLPGRLIVCLCGNDSHFCDSESAESGVFGARSKRKAGESARKTRPN